MAGTPNLEWFVDQFCIGRLRGRKLYDACNDLVEAAPPGARGVLYLPFLKGERAPFLQPSATAGFLGVTDASQRGDLLRAIYEGVTFSLRDCYSAMGTPVDRVELTGGGARSDTWCQILADVLGCQVNRPQGSELGAKGAALLAGIGGGFYRGFEEAIEQTVRAEKTFSAEAKAKRIYDELFGLYRSLYQGLEPFWLRRAQLSI
jgi:sugar (pentulose or hexulose) kinase